MLFEHIPTHAPDVLGKLQRDMELIEKWGDDPAPEIVSLAREILRMPTG